MLQDFFKIPNGGVIRDPPITVLAHYDPSDNTYTLKTYADVTVSPHIAHLTVPINLRRPGPPPCDVEARLYSRVAAPPTGPAATAVKHCQAYFIRSGILGQYNSLINFDTISLLRIRLY
ncbi:unnamed protein product [Rhizophagus irregularis]|nr:unnamed protein product [Rhizophagus irregularis]